MSSIPPPKKYAPNNFALGICSLQYYSMPDIWDPCHSEEMLLGMLAIIQERNADCIGKRRDPAIEQNEKRMNRVFIDLHTAENTHRQAVPSRARFEAILNRIPTAAKEKAAQPQLEVDQLRHALHEAGREVRESKKQQEAADRKSALER